MTTTARFDFTELKIPTTFDELKTSLEDLREQLSDVKLPTSFDELKASISEWQDQLADLPKVELPSVDQVVDFARDAMYVGVGLVVMTAERIQAMQREMLEQLKTQLEDTRENWRKVVEDVRAAA